MVAASGALKALLRVEFPSLTFVELYGYDIKFGKNRAFTLIRLFASIPKILIRIKREKVWLKEFVRCEKPDLVISDNRYGLAIPDVCCVFVTHQLLIKTPFGRLADRLLQRINNRFIRRFSWCWVPDVEQAGGLAGELSHPEKMPDIPVRYIGWLSRFGTEKEGTDRAGGRQDQLLVLLSGPEPQRTLLETMILEQAAGCPYRMTLVRGLPEGGHGLGMVREGMVIYDHLPAVELEREIRRATVVIARPGYSTVMDLARLGKRAVLVPTPGQTEQEYLGQRLAERGWAVCVEQRNLSLLGALSAAGSISFGTVDEQNRDGLQTAIEEVIRSCR